MPEPMPLAASPYVSLTTFRRSGVGVPTPVWVVRLPGGSLGVWTVAESWKVRRIRANPAVTVALCDVRGRHRGPEIPGKATILDDSGTAEVRRALAAKYGMRAVLLLWASRLRRGRSGTVGLRIALSNVVSPPDTGRETDGR
ncbi:PPOX class F420-dependent oxidoreductase [Pilimelia columellifera]|uniref:PPOX class F420-dependent oxidoreductase n=1 Tax=Pilimelia columellifera subsp. columellifera TaxID=706583 RepID=A0ABN3NDM2_9ACTN